MAAPMFVVTGTPHAYGDRQNRLADEPDPAARTPLQQSLDDFSRNWRSSFWRSVWWSLACPLYREMPILDSPDVRRGAGSGCNPRGAQLHSDHRVGDGDAEDGQRKCHYQRPEGGGEASVPSRSFVPIRPVRLHRIRCASRKSMPTANCWTGRTSNCRTTRSACC